MRILKDATIARARLASCFATTNAAGEIADLQSQWEQVPAIFTRGTGTKSATGTDDNEPCRHRTADGPTLWGAYWR